MTTWSPKLVDAGAYAKTRLRGTVWERSDLARVTYGILTAVGAGIGKIGLSPNALTGLSLVFAGAAGVALALGQFGIGALLIVVSGICDVLDGAVARATGKVSRFGALLDSTVDRLSDALPLVGLLVLLAPRPWLALIPALAMVGGFTVPYVRARAEAIGVVLPPLFMRRAERVLLLVLSLLLGALPFEPPLPAVLTLLGIGLMAALSFVGAASALRAAHTALEGKPEVKPVEPVRVGHGVRLELASRKERLPRDEREPPPKSVPSTAGITASGP